MSSFEEWLPGNPHVWSLRIDKARVRRLATDADTHAFRDAYVDPSGPSDEQVRWHEVRAADGSDATGFEISPYSYRFRDERWYYVWDASTGVIWDTDAVTGCLLLATRCADGRYAVNGAVPGGEDLVRAAVRITGLAVDGGRAVRAEDEAAAHSADSSSDPMTDDSEGHDDPGGRSAQITPRRTRRTDHTLALTTPARALLRCHLGGGETRLEHARRPRGDAGPS